MTFKPLTVHFYIFAEISRSEPVGYANQLIKKTSRKQQANNNCKKLKSKILTHELC
ncbi:hypothetical protein NC99_27030 [Sunxiuqinia dokdonensis]|uniref:Uncharacterized protein n=1 Tax=Sunxiuqinia dokdonensis TaxID=1409788 RepID=A0A0L8V7Y7_9BACT|nr:hypothetical protein NC99_27030 [Sunxiuqinia dokdonensis]